MEITDLDELSQAPFEELPNSNISFWRWPTNKTRPKWRVNGPVKPATFKTPTDQNYCKLGGYFTWKEVQRARMEPESMELDKIQQNITLFSLPI